MFLNTVFATHFFDHQVPFLRRKHSAFEIEDLPGLWRIHWQVGNKTVISTFYTQIDQACLLWGIVSIAIFLIAQFSAIDWRVQAIIGSALTLLGTGMMLKLAHRWSVIEPLKQIMIAWAGLMLLGMALTDLSIFLGWGSVLAQLCPLWLGLSALGYFYTGLKMRSRAFFLTGLLHLTGMGVLPYIHQFQYAATGILLGLSVMFLAELQWDSSGVCAMHKGTINS
jgi:hypothetical protein